MLVLELEAAPPVFTGSAGKGGQAKGASGREAASTTFCQRAGVKSASAMLFSSPIWATMSPTLRCTGAEAAVGLGEGQTQQALLGELAARFEMLGHLVEPGVGWKRHDVTLFYIRKVYGYVLTTSRRSKKRTGLAFAIA